MISWHKLTQFFYFWHQILCKKYHPPINLLYVGFLFFQAVFKPSSSRLTTTATAGETTVSDGPHTTEEERPPTSSSQQSTPEDRTTDSRLTRHNLATSSSSSKTTANNGPPSTDNWTQDLPGNVNNTTIKITTAIERAHKQIPVEKHFNSLWVIAPTAVSVLILISVITLVCCIIKKKFCCKCHKNDIYMTSHQLMKK